HVYLSSIVIALGAAAGFVMTKEGLSSKILFREEILKLTSIPIIGELAYNKNKDSVVVERGIRTFIAEGFRELRISLFNLGIDTGHKKILVTSSISGEGKSFIAINLAVSLALTSKRVVLIDMDLHSPSLGKLLVNNPKLGVSQLLESLCDPDEIIINTSLTESLY